jgi:hypothetical protein
MSWVGANLHRRSIFSPGSQSIYNVALCVSVAQLDRASVSEAEGLGFESQRAQIFILCLEAVFVSYPEVSGYEP